MSGNVQEPHSLSLVDHTTCQKDIDNISRETCSVSNTIVQENPQIHAKPATTGRSRLSKALIRPVIPNGLKESLEAWKENPKSFFDELNLKTDLIDNLDAPAVDFELRRQVITKIAEMKALGNLQYALQIRWIFGTLFFRDIVALFRKANSLPRGSSGLHVVGAALEHLRMPPERAQEFTHLWKVGEVYSIIGEKLGPRAWFALAGVLIRAE